MFGLSGGEILLIALIALILFGNEKLPENMRKLMKSFHQFRKTFGSFHQSWQEVKKDLHESIQFQEEKAEILELKKKVTALQHEFGISESSPQLPHTISQEEIDTYQQGLTSEKSKEIQVLCHPPPSP